jgi:uridylate kinase
MGADQSKGRYRRILLKLSGEVLQNREQGLNIDATVARGVADRIQAVTRMGAEVGIVIGGGNIFRGAAGEGRGIDRGTGDQMGMLATVMNGLALQAACDAAAVEAVVMGAWEIGRIVEPFNRRRARALLSEGKVVIFVAGTGNPYFSTDTAAALRAAEIGADVLLKATKVDGVYSDDPLTNAQAERYERLTYKDAIARGLRIMDLAAFSLCMDNRIPIIVFDFFKDGSMEAVIRGENVGTRVAS